MRTELDGDVGVVLKGVRQLKALAQPDWVVAYKPSTQTALHAPLFGGSGDLVHLEVHIAKTHRARGGHLQERRLGSPVDPLGVEVGLNGPDAFLQPLF